MPDTTTNPQPRVKAKATATDESLMMGVGAKGGISVYGLQRFPITLYWEQWKQIRALFDSGEFEEFATEHAASLSEKESYQRNVDKTDLYTVNAADLVFVQQAADKAKTAGDLDGAIKYATIKKSAEANKLKVSAGDMLEIMTLKAQAGK